MIGSVFFVMDYLEGRIFWEALLPECDRDERVAIYDAMNAALASLHDVDPAQGRDCPISAGRAAITSAKIGALGPAIPRLRDGADPRYGCTDRLARGEPAGG